jgi:hypothetical protein
MTRARGDLTRQLERALVAAHRRRRYRLGLALLGLVALATAAAWLLASW